MTRSRPLGLVAMALLGVLASSAPCAAMNTGDYLQTYANLTGEVVLDNARVVAQKFVIQPGQSTGRHPLESDQLLVFIKGGLLTSQATGRTTLWKEGRVAWQSTTDHAEDGYTNSGTTPVEFISVTLKPVARTAARSGGASKYHYLNYPNIPGEDLLEDGRVIVQRFVIQPGQWEGVHAHHPDMLYIHVKGGQWASRSKKEPETPYPEPAPDGLVGWEPTIPLSEGHESHNIGKTPIDLIWVTLKQ
jgi:quercetin dioxygenase-like cupin family protein